MDEKYEFISNLKGGRHIFSMARITLDHHRRRLEDGVGDLSNAELLVVRLLRRDDRRIRREHEVDTYDHSDLVHHSEGLR